MLTFVAEADWCSTPLQTSSMSHRKFEQPRCVHHLWDGTWSREPELTFPPSTYRHGSLGFLPRKRAARHRGKAKSFPIVSHER